MKEATKEAHHIFQGSEEGHNFQADSPENRLHYIQWYVHCRCEMIDGES
jgi:hypothetical protein